jgi:hypothetical protein
LRTVSLGFCSRTGFAPGNAVARPIGVKGCVSDRSRWQEAQADAGFDGGDPEEARTTAPDTSEIASKLLRM